MMVRGAYAIGRERDAISRAGPGTAKVLILELEFTGISEILGKGSKKK